MVVLSLAFLTACGSLGSTVQPENTRAVGAPTLVATSQLIPSPSPVEPSQVAESVATQPSATAPSPETLLCSGVLTQAQTEGPYYIPDSPERRNLVEEGMGGTPLVITGRVFGRHCQPVAGAKVDFWQTDDQGQYDNSGYRLRGHQFSDENGNYTLETILPGEYPGRTSHIHVKVFAPDGSELLTTQIYIPGLSDQTPDRIYDPQLLAQDMEPGVDGRRRLGFNFVLDT